MVHGGLGLRSSELLSPAAYWAAWADILPIIAERAPTLAARALEELERRDSPVHCARQAAAAEAAVTRPAFQDKPSWRDLADGARPPERAQDGDDEPGQWPHGWQFYASLGLITHHRETAVLPTLDAGTQARLRSQSGAHAGDHITALPRCEWTIATPLRMNGMLRRRARLPIATGNRQDVYGDYGAAWPRDGRLRRRGAAVERAFRPLWAESTVQASEHPLVRELVPTVPASD